MRKIFILLAAMFAIVGFLGVTQSASAGERCVREATGACAAAKRAAVRPAFSGKLAPTKAPMACLRVLVDPSLTEIVLIEGTSVKGRVITSIGANSGHTIHDRSRGIDVKEFCFKRRLVSNLSAFTICNGHTPGQGNHHTLSGRWLASLKRTGHAGDYLSLLGTRRTNDPEIKNVYTASLYRRMYGG